MKKLFLFGLGWLLGSTILAQTFSGSGGSIPGTATTATCFPINVTGVGNINTNTIGLAQVCFTITHPFLDELEVTLRAPDGTTVPLTIQNGGSGDNYTNTCFSATATNSIKFGTPPFTGTYLPEGYLGAVNNGQNANGQWRLCVQDRRTAGNAGVLNSWNLTFSNAPAPAPPALPTCVTTLSSSSTCAAAPAICDFNGLCGSTSGSTVQTWTELTSASCFGFQNNFFVRFVAAASTASFSVWVPTSSSTFPNGGVQMLFFSGTCGSGPVTTYGCYPHILPYSAGSPVISVVTASGLTPGNTYYILIDGFGGDVSTFRLAATSGVNVFAVTPDSATICQGGSVTLNATGGNNVYNWSPSSGLNTTTGPTVIANPTTTTTYTATSSTPLGCPINRTAVVTVNTPPQISTEPITNPQTVCQGDPFASVTLAAFTGSGTSNTVQWYSNTTPSNTGGTLIPGATVPTFQPSSTLLGTTYYYAVVTNNVGCSDTSAVVGPITVTPQIAGPVFVLGASSTRCPAAGTVVYGASGTTAPITYTLDAASLAAGNTIDPATGEVTYVAGWTGAAIITATVAGCSGPLTATHTATTSTPVSPVTNFSYSSPVCSTGPNPVPILASGFTPGGTFSAPSGLSINPSTGVINLAASTLGSYTVTYTLPADPATCRPAASGTASITINAVITPVTSFLYVSPICLNGSNASPVLGPGFTAGGTWTSVPSTGISLDPNSGVINVGSSTAGNYTITYTISGLACAIGGTASSSLLVNLTPGQTANTTFSYNSPVCNSTASQLPQLATGFTTGGTFSANSGGLAINSTTGLINHGVSTPGTYTVTYSVPASGCRPAASGTASITISPVVTPVTGFTYPSPVCQNSGTISPTLVPGFTTGGAFTAPAGLSIVGATGVINTNTSTPGTYTVAYNLPPNGCNPAGSGTFAVTITPVVTPVTTFSYTGPICANGIATAPNTPVGFTFGGTFSSVPAGLTINPTTGIITPASSTPGTYDVTYSLPAIGCNPAGNNTVSVTISTVNTPVTSFSYATPVCQGTGPYLPTLGPGFTTGGIFSGTGGLAVNASTGQLNTASAAPGTYTITYIVQATGCNPAGNTSFNIEISPATPPIVGFTLPAAVCGGSGNINPTQAVGFTAGGTFSAAPSGLVINATTGIINTNTSTPGNYTVSYNVPVNGCRPAGSESVPFTINPVSTPVTGFSYSNPVCQNSGSITPVLAANFTTGGTFSAPAGLTLSSTTGTINTNTSTPGTYLVTYLINAVGCNPAGSSTFSITLSPSISPVTQFTIPASICSADGLITPALGSGFTTGGTFTSSPAGLSINPTTGVINPATSTPGNYSVIYEVLATGCNPPASTTVPTVVTATTTAQVGFSYLSPVCQTVAFLGPTFSPGFTPGGTFTAPAGLSINATTGLLNLGTSAAGTYNVTYTLPTVGCAVGGTNTASVTVNAPTAPGTNFSYTTPVCANGTNPLPIAGTGFTVGGTYSAPAGLSINSTTGLVNLAASTPGTYLITYSVAAGACSVAGSGTFSLTILPNTTPNTSFSYAGPVCNNSVPLLPSLSTGFVTGGTFTSTPGLSINPTTGVITPATSTPGTYTVTYQVAASSCQPAGTGTATITIDPTITPVVGFSYATPLCVRSTAAVTPQLATGFTVGGQFSATPSGLSLNATTGAVNLAASAAGNYNITYTLASSGCQLAASQTSTLTIVAAVTPGTNFSYNTPVCASAAGIALPVPGAGFSTGGVFTATGGLAINANTGAVSLGSNPPGSYTITYGFAGGTTAANCVTPASRTAPLVIQPNTQPNVSFSYPSPVCSYGASSLAPQTAVGFTTGGTFSATGGLLINPTSGVVTLSGQAAGTYTITYQVSTPCTSASGSASLVIRDVPIPTVPPVGVCDSGTVTFQASGVGTFEWFADPALTQLVNTGNTFSVFTNRDTVFYVRSFLNGCNSVGFTAAQALVVAPPVKPALGRDTLICAGDAISLQTATFNSTYQYVWSTGTSGAALSVTQPGTYILTASILPAGCSSSDTITIGQYTICDDIYFPNAFSPNKDGLNDRFGALGNIAPVTKYTMVIYNRWGQAVFTASNPAQRWDGTMNGKAQDPGNFTYRVQYDYRGRPRTRSGNLMLVR